MILTIALLLALLVVLTISLVAARLNIDELNKEVDRAWSRQDIEQRKHTEAVQRLLAYGAKAVAVKPVRGHHKADAYYQRVVIDGDAHRFTVEALKEARARELREIAREETNETVS